MTTHARGNDEVKNNVKNHSELDFESLKEGFVQLRDDVSKLLNNAVGIGRSGAMSVKDRATHAVDNLKDRGVDSLEAVEEKISENPLASTLIAFAAGYVFAKLFSRR